MWPLLVLLACSQVSLAAHRFEHSATEVDEVCEVCLQFERNDDIVVDAARQAALPVPPFAAAAETRVTVYAQDFSHYRSRASPQDLKRP